MSDRIEGLYKRIKRMIEYGTGDGIRLEDWRIGGLKDWRIEGFDTWIIGGLEDWMESLERRIAKD